MILDGFDADRYGNVPLEQIAVEHQPLHRVFLSIYRNWKKTADAGDLGAMKLIVRIPVGMVNEREAFQHWAEGRRNIVWDVSEM